MNPRFRAEWVVVSEELLILASCLLRPMIRNSVLEEFSVRRFAVIQDEIWSRALWRWSILESKGMIERAECHLHRGGGLGNKRKWGWWEEWCTWRRVVDQGQSLGDTAGGCVPGRQVSFTFERKQRDDRYDLNQLRTEPWIPNQDERQVIKMSWSIVSKAAL